MNKRPKIGRGLFYTRDSGGKSEMNPPAYVAWAQERARALEVRFQGTPAQIDSMIRTKKSSDGDIFLDYQVTGEKLSRPGLDALLHVAETDPEVSHVFIPRRDRLARPNDPMDGMQLENRFRRLGITIVFDSLTKDPLRRGQREDIGEAIRSYIDYDTAGQYRRNLAQQIVTAQIELAKQGYSTGGRPPYGYCRWLVKADGTKTRQLEDGERVRQRGHHVVWLPGAEDKLQVIRRILKDLQSQPASRIAAKLTAEGIPTPDHDRQRTDHGVLHRTSGVWHSNTVTNIARNPLNVMLCSYGRRSMGDQLRFSPSGPRELEDADVHEDGKVKVVHNPSSLVLLNPVAVPYEPIVDRATHENLMELLDRRGGTQRGKPRSRKLSENPLGCRIIDVSCRWPMYRQPYKHTFKYVCGLYQQSRGQKCAHNSVEGPVAVRYLLATIRTRFFPKGFLDRLREKLQQRAMQAEDTNPQELLQRENTLSEISRQLQDVTRNMALAKNDEQREAMASIFDELQQKRKILEEEIAKLKAFASCGNNDDEVEAMNFAQALVEQADDTENLGALAQLFQDLNARLFLRFQPIQFGKRTLHKVTTGVVTIGSAAAPVPIYEGPTSRAKLKAPAAKLATGPGIQGAPLRGPVISGLEEASLGNVNRGERI